MPHIRIMAVIAIEPQVEAPSFETNKSNESNLQYKRTHLPHLCAETADKFTYMGNN